MLPGAAYYYTLPQDASGRSNPKLKKALYAGSGILALLGIFSAPVLIPYLFPKFLDAIVVIQILSIAIVPRTITFMHTSEFMGNEKVRTVVIGSLIFIAIQIPLIFILGDLYGILGIATSLVLASVAEAGYLVVIKRIRL